MHLARAKGNGNERPDEAEGNEKRSLDHPLQGLLPVFHLVLTIKDLRKMARRNENRDARRGRYHRQRSAYRQELFELGFRQKYAPS